MLVEQAHRELTKRGALGADGGFERTPTPREFNGEYFALMLREKRKVCDGWEYDQEYKHADRPKGADLARDEKVKQRRLSVKVAQAQGVAGALPGAASAADASADAAEFDIELKHDRLNVTHLKIESADTNVLTRRSVGALDSDLDITTAYGGRRAQTFASRG